MNTKRNLMQLGLRRAVAGLHSLRRAADPAPLLTPSRPLERRGAVSLQKIRAAVSLLVCALWLPGTASAERAAEFGLDRRRATASVNLWARVPAAG